MIPAHEALLLPTALLSEEQRARADALETLIDQYVRANMERRGCDFDTEETDLNVVAEVNQRLKAAGYNVNWQQLAKPNRLNPQGAMKLVGFRLAISPTTESYQKAGSGLVLS